jgi:hypothetical protein
MATITGRHFDHKLDGGRPRVTMMANQKISQLAPYAGLILVVSLVIFFLVRYYVFEGFFLPWIYGDTYSKLDDNKRRGFINHHVAATAKLVMLAFAAVPFFAILAGKAAFHTPFAGSKIVTYGDGTSAITNDMSNLTSHSAARTQSSFHRHVHLRAHLPCKAIVRCRCPPHWLRHHCSDCCVLGCQLETPARCLFGVHPVLSMGYVGHPLPRPMLANPRETGMFDVIAESWPHIAIILYRVYPNDHKFLSYIMLLAALVTFFGTIVETIVVMYFWGHAWHRWTLVFKIVTPILHVVFTAAQLWGTKNFYSMWRYQKRKMQEKPADVELGDVPVINSHQPSDKAIDSTAQKSK